MTRAPRLTVEAGTLSAGMDPGGGHLRGVPERNALELVEELGQAELRGVAGLREPREAEDEAREVAAVVGQGSHLVAQVVRQLDGSRPATAARATDEWDDGRGHEAFASTGKRMSSGTPSASALAARNSGVSGRSPLSIRQAYATDTPVFLASQAIVRPCCSRTRSTFEESTLPLDLSA